MSEFKDCSFCGNCHTADWPCREYIAAHLPKPNPQRMYHIGADGKPTPIDEPVTLRERAAIAAMQGLLANPIAIQECWKIEDLAVKKADALVAELKKEVAR